MGGIGEVYYCYAYFTNIIFLGHVICLYEGTMIHIFMETGVGRGDFKAPYCLSCHADITAYVRGWDTCIDC